MGIEVQDVLLPNSSVSLRFISTNGKRAAIERATRVFLRVWNSIDLVDRREIERHWGEACRPFPNVSLEDPWHGTIESLAICESGGHALRFDWPTMDMLPDSECSASIAHELAHVHQWATEKHRLNLTDADLSRTIPGVFFEMLSPMGRCELHADETMTRWGFDPFATMIWVKRFAEVSQGKLRLRSEPLTRKYARATARQDRLRSYIDLRAFTQKRSPMSEL